MISWKHPFERLNEEFELTQKKKEALGRLLDAGKISQSTYDSFNEKIDEAIAEIERQQNALLEKMNSKADELENHIKTLETILANFEIRHVTGEIEEEVYQREVDLLSTGLETAREELGTVKETVDQLSSSMPVQATETEASEELEMQTTENVEIIQPETGELEESSQSVDINKTPEEVAEQTLPELPTETIEGNEEETICQSQETFEEKTEDVEEEQQETWQETEDEETTTIEEPQLEAAAEEDEETTQTIEEPQESW